MCANLECRCSAPVLRENQPSGISPLLPGSYKLRNKLLLISRLKLYICPVQLPNLRLGNSLSISPVELSESRSPILSQTHQPLYRTPGQVQSAAIRPWWPHQSNFLALALNIIIFARFLTRIFAGTTPSHGHSTRSTTRSTSGNTVSSSANSHSRRANWPAFEVDRS